VVVSRRSSSRALREDMLPPPIITRLEKLSTVPPPSFDQRNWPPLGWESDDLPIHGLQSGSFAVHRIAKGKGRIAVCQGCMASGKTL
jgi:hypothetical protein